MAWVDGPGGSSHVLPTIELAHGIEHRFVPKKGRGLFATRSFCPGDIVITNRPLLAVDGENNNLMSFCESELSTGSQVSLSAQLTFLAAQDARIAQALSDLDDTYFPFTQKESRLDKNPDRSNSKKLTQLVHIPDMLQALSSLVLPLLPQLWQYFPVHEHVKLSGERVSRICSVNCFGAKRNGTGSWLFPLVSLINHSNSPNLGIMPNNERAVEDAHDLGRPPTVLIAERAIAPGDELTVAYHRDRETLKTKWGIQEPC